MILHPNIKNLIDSISVDSFDSSSVDTSPPPSESIDDWVKSTKLNLNQYTVDKWVEFIRKDTLKIPLEREGYYQNRDVEFWMSGFFDFTKCSEIINKYGVGVQKYLDLGCASGRVLRHFAFQSDIPEVWGCDVNEFYINWLIENSPKHVRPVHTTAIPHLPFEDNYFNLITAFSVFTHISVFESTFLCELRRIMKPGSIAIITLQLENSFDWWQKQCNAIPLDAYCKWLLRDNPEFKSAILKNRVVCVGNENTPYNSFVHHSTDYVYKVFGRYFEILEIIPCFHGVIGGGNNQSGVILRK